MAGRPKLRALTAKLDSPDAQDTLFTNIANGSSFKAEAERLGVTRAALYEWLNGDDSRKERLAHARQCQAAGFVEDAGEMLETADADNWKQRKELASHRRWMAERLDRQTWGQQPNQSVTLNVAELHLSLLKSLPTAPTVQLQVQEVKALSAGQSTDYPSVEAGDGGESDTPPA